RGPGGRPAGERPQRLGGAEERPQQGAGAEEKPQELGAAETAVAEPADSAQKSEGPPQEMTTLGTVTVVEGVGQIPEHFHAWFWGLAVLSALCLLVYFWRMDGEQLEILKELIVSVVPLGVLTVIVLAVILFGITTATESAAVGAVGALYLAVMARYARQVWWWSLVGVVLGVVLGWWQGEDFMS